MTFLHLRARACHDETRSRWRTVTFEATSPTQTSAALTFFDSIAIVFARAVAFPAERHLFTNTSHAHRARTERAQRRIAAAPRHRPRRDAVAAAHRLRHHRPHAARPRPRSALSSIEPTSYNPSASSSCREHVPRPRSRARPPPTPAAAPSSRTDRSPTPPRLDSAAPTPVPTHHLPSLRARAVFARSRRIHRSNLCTRVRPVVSAM